MNKLLLNKKASSIVGSDFASLWSDWFFFIAKTLDWKIHYRLWKNRERTRTVYIARVQNYSGRYKCLQRFYLSLKFEEPFCHERVNDCTQKISLHAEGVFWAYELREKKRRIFKKVEFCWNRWTFSVNMKIHTYWTRFQISSTSEVINRIQLIFSLCLCDI